MFCRIYHVAPSPPGVPNLPHLATGERLLYCGCPAWTRLVMGITSRPPGALGFQLWRCHELDTLALQMAVAAGHLPEATCKNKVMDNTEAIALIDLLKLD